MCQLQKSFATLQTKLWEFAGMHIDWCVKQPESHVEITGGNTPLAENNTTTAKLMWLNLSAKNTGRQGGGSEREEEVCKNASTEVDKPHRVTWKP